MLGAAHILVATLFRRSFLSCLYSDSALTVCYNSAIVLEKVAEYFCYNHKNRNREDVPDMEIPPELCLELLMAADFLDSERNDDNPNPFLLLILISSINIVMMACKGVYGTHTDG